MLNRLPLNEVLFHECQLISGTVVVQPHLFHWSEQWILQHWEFSELK